MKPTDPEKLPDDLVWAEGGHASDVALGALADGQAASLPERVVSHVHGCPTCTQHLGHAALLSLHVGRELATVEAHERALVTARRPLPRVAIALGLLVAAAALVPVLLARPAPAPTLGTAALAARVLRAVAVSVTSHESTLGVLLTYGTATALVVAAFVVVKLLPRKEVSS